MAPTNTAMESMGDPITYEFKNDYHVGCVYQTRINPPHPFHFHWYSSGKDIDKAQWEFHYRILKPCEDLNKAEWCDIIIRHGRTEKNVWQIVTLDALHQPIEAGDMIQYTLKFKCTDNAVKVVATALGEV